MELVIAGLAMLFILIGAVMFLLGMNGKIGTNLTVLGIAILATGLVILMVRG